MDGLAQLQANNLARKGRYGDTELLHVSKSEIAGLDNLARSMGYDGLTTNPETGAKEAFLFAPLLAPMLAGGLGGFAGTALGTGLLAGGLGAVEAKLRGMDDPLKQGLMAGLTTGGLSAIGGAATGAAEGAQAAAGIAPAAGAVAPIPSVAETQALQMAAPQPGLQAQLAPDLASAGMVGQPYLAQGTGGITGLQGALPTAPVGGAAGAAMPQGFMDRVGASLSAAPSRFMNTVTTLSENPEAMKTFMANPATKMGAASALMGYTGSAGLEEQSKLKEESAADEEKRRGKYDEARNRILSNYAAVGRSAPWMYQEGGEVDLPRYLRGEGDGMSDGIPALIDGEQPAALSDGEFVIPADVVSALGNGSSEAGARKLYELMEKVRMQAYGRNSQTNEVDDVDDLMEDEEDKEGEED